MLVSQPGRSIMISPSELGFDCNDSHAVQAIGGSYRLRKHGDVAGLRVDIGISPVFEAELAGGHGRLKSAGPVNSGATGLGQSKSS